MVDRLPEGWRATAVAENRAAREWRRKFEDLLETVKWKPMKSAPQNRKIACLWRDRYSYNDKGGPRYSVSSTFWNPETGTWSTWMSSHWDPVAWVDFPEFNPQLIEDL